MIISILSGHGKLNQEPTEVVFADQAGWIKIGDKTFGCKKGTWFWGKRQELIDELQRFERYDIILFILQMLENSSTGR